MSRVCKICSHPKRLDIDRALMQGQTLTSISKKYGMAEASVMNHRDKHLSRQLVTAAKKRDLMSSNGLLDILESLLQTTDLVISEAWRQQKLGVALSGIGKAAGIVKIVGDMVYQLKSLEQVEKQKNEPIQINVTLTDDDSFSSSNDRINVAMPAKRQSLPEPEQEPAIEPAVKRFVRRAIPKPMSIVKPIVKRPVKPVKPVKPVVKPKPKPKPKQKPPKCKKPKPKPAVPEPEDEFTKMREKYLKPAGIPDEVPIFSDAELDEIDGEGLSLRTRLEKRPLHERA